MFLGFHSETKSKRRKGREIANLVQYKTILLQCVFRNCWLRFLFERDSLDMFFITLLRHRHFRRIDVHQCSCNLYIPRNKESNLHDENCTQENVKYHINRDWTGKLQCSHTVKASSEEVIVMYSEKMKATTWNRMCERVFLS